ncbi:hypothetical protein CEXT_134671, partial [Caerostris extrusa]
NKAVPALGYLSFKWLIFTVPMARQLSETQVSRVKHLQPIRYIAFRVSVFTV